MSYAVSYSRWCDSYESCVDCAFGVSSKKIVTKTYVKEVFPLFFLRSSTTVDLPFKFLIHSELVFEWCKIGIQLYSLACFSSAVYYLSVFPDHLLKRLSFPYCVFLAPQSKISRPYLHGFISYLSILFQRYLFLHQFFCSFWGVILHPGLSR